MDNEKVDGCMNGVLLSLGYGEIRNPLHIPKGCMNGNSPFKAARTVVLLVSSSYH